MVLRSNNLFFQALADGLPTLPKLLDCQRIYLEAARLEVAKYRLLSSERSESSSPFFRNLPLLNPHVGYRSERLTEPSD